MISSTSTQANKLVELKKCCDFVSWQEVPYVQGATSVAVEILLRVRCLLHTQIMLPGLDNNTRIAYGHLSIF
jgi:hypothetical protein